jgi:hypothetical protein
MISGRTILQGAVAATSLSIMAHVAWQTPHGEPNAVLDHRSLNNVLVDWVIV